MDDATVERYLRRIGVDRPGQPTSDALGRLQAAHLLTVPFENLSVHLGEPIVLEEAPLVDKVVERHRGGFCYELNGLFAELLRALGFDVTLLAARVHGDRGLSPPFDHLALRVEADGPWLADVGFGDFSVNPLRLDGRGAQVDEAGTFLVEEAGDGDIDVIRDGRPQYRVELRARQLEEFVPMCWWHQTSPLSHFTRTLTCSRRTAGGRVTLSGRRLIRTEHGRRAEETLDRDSEVLAAYEEHFGIRLDRVPVVSLSPPAR